MRLLRRFGNLQARIVLTVTYVVMVIPVGLVARLVSDRLGRHTGPRWHPKSGEEDLTQASRRQY